MSNPELPRTPVDRRALLTGIGGLSIGAGAGRATAGRQGNAPDAVPLMPSISILDHGARTDAKDNKIAIQRAVKAALECGRSVLIPPGTFEFSQLDFDRNDAAIPSRLVLTGTGTLRSTFKGIAITARTGQFYDLVIDGLAFESREGAGTTLLDGDRFMRLVITPGTQISGFDHVLVARDYLQSVRILGAIVRGGRGAVVRAPLAYDCTFAHNIIEFVTDGIVIDGSGDPAVNTCRILHNVIEGIGGRAIVLGACLATSITGNYFENNVGGDILLNAGTAPHKGLRVQDNSIQMSKDRLAAGNYGIVWGRSTALPVRSGGNFCNGPMHDTREVTAIIEMTGDHSAVELYTGYRPESDIGRKPVGRTIYSDGMAQHIAWFDRYLSLDPYNNEVRFGGRHASPAAGSLEPPVVTFGAASPQDNPASFDRKHWARGSLVLNAQHLPGTPFGWMCYRSGAPGSWSQLASAHHS